MTDNAMNLSLETVLEFANTTFSGMPIWAMIALPLLAFSYDGLHRDRSTSWAGVKTLGTVLLAFAAAGYLNVSGSWDWGYVLMAVAGFNGFQHFKKYRKSESSADRFPGRYQRADRQVMSVVLPAILSGLTLMPMYSFDIRENLEDIRENIEQTCATYGERLAETVQHDEKIRTRQALVYDVDANDRELVFHYVYADGATGLASVNMGDIGAVEEFRAIVDAMNAVERGERDCVIVNLEQEFLRATLDADHYVDRDFSLVE